MENSLDQKKRFAKRVISDIHLDDFENIRSSCGRVSKVTDVDIRETEHFYVVASKREMHAWSGYSGIEWTEWVYVFLKSKKTGEVRKIRGEMVTTRNQYDSQYDKKNLWGYNQVKIRVIREDVIAVGWFNGEKTVQEKVIDITKVYEEVKN